MCWLAYSSILNTGRVLGIQWVDETLEARFDDDSFYEENKEQQIESLDLMEI